MPESFDIDPQIVIELRDHSKVMLFDYFWFFQAGAVDIEKYNNNVYKLDQNGSMLWTIKRNHISGEDPFVHIYWHDESLNAVSASMIFYKVDVNTGLAIPVPSLMS